MRVTGWVLALVVVVPCLAGAQKKGQKDASQMAGYDRAARATVLHVANVYVAADAGAAPVTQVTPGHEVVISSRNGAWLNVFANTDDKLDNDPDNAPEFEDPGAHPDPSSGWIRDKGLVSPATPHGDALLYGAAAEFEGQAMQPHAPKGAAEAAQLLYRRVGDYFPESPVAEEAAFRAADIRWQLQKLDNSTLPSAREMDPVLRPRMYDADLKKVMKKYAGRPAEARAAFDLLDAKMCGDWQGLPKCPEMESDLYLKYAARYPEGPKSAEALYDAAYRQGVLVTMYTVDNNTKRADAAKRNCQSIADELTQRAPRSDWAARAQAIAFKVAQGIPVYGSDRD